MIAEQEGLPHEFKKQGPRLSARPPFVFDRDLVNQVEPLRENILRLPLHTGVSGYLQILRGRTRSLRRDCVVRRALAAVLGPVDHAAKRPAPLICGPVPPLQ